MDHLIVGKRRLNSRCFNSVYSSFSHVFFLFCIHHVSWTCRFFRMIKKTVNEGVFCFVFVQRCPYCFLQKAVDSGCGRQFIDGQVLVDGWEILFISLAAPEHIVVYRYQHAVGVKAVKLPGCIAKIGYHIEANRMWIIHGLERNNERTDQIENKKIENEPTTSRAVFVCNYWTPQL